MKNAVNLSEAYRRINIMADASAEEISRAYQAYVESALLAEYEDLRLMQAEANRKNLTSTLQYRLRANRMDQIERELI